MYFLKVHGRENNLNINKIEEEISKISESKINEFIDKMYEDIQNSKAENLPIENKRNIIINLIKAASQLDNKTLKEEIASVVLGASLVSILGSVASSLITPYVKMGIDKLILDKEFKKVVEATEIENVKTQEDSDKILKKYNNIEVGMREEEVIKILGKNYSKNTLKSIKHLQYLFSFGISSRQSYTFKGVRHVVKAIQKDMAIDIMFSDEGKVSDKTIKITSK